MRKWNHYVCERCGETTIARHDNEGVTPFMIDCTCCSGGLAYSTMFSGSQDDSQQAHVVFWRPENIMDALEVINKQPEECRKWWLEHYKKGGSLMRKA